MLSQPGSADRAGFKIPAVTSAESSMSSSLSRLRLLMIPVLLGLFAVVGLAVQSSESTNSDDSGATTGQLELDDADDTERADASLEPVEPSDGGPPEVTVSSGDGNVVLRFDPDGTVRARPSPTEPGGGDEIELGPGPGDSYQIGPGGELMPEPGDPTAEQADDSGVVLAPSDESGVVVVTPLGDSIQLRADGVDGGVSATDLNNESAAVVPNADGLVVLDDGTTIGPLDVPSITVAGIESRSMPWRLIFSTIAVIAAVSAATGLALHRKSEEAPVIVGRSSGSRVRTVPFAELMERLAADPDPSRAVRVGFDAAQAGLGGLPARAVDETPFEWEARVSTARPDVSGPVQVVCDLFARARFAPGDADENDRAAMIEQLQAIHEKQRTSTGSWALEASGG